MGLDPEIKAMSDILQALESLEDGSRIRVLNWAISKYKLDNVMSVDEKRSTAGISSIESKSSTVVPAGVVSDQINIADFEDLGEFYSQIDPSTDSEKVLTIGCFYQINRGYDDLNAADLNKELKHLGYRVSNVTVSISLLMKKKPALMIQTRKEGNSKQARKKYKVTQAGIKYVEKLLMKVDEE